jgi:hypothetical protein
MKLPYGVVVHGYTAKDAHSIGVAQVSRRRPQAREMCRARCLPLWCFVFTAA